MTPRRSSGCGACIPELTTRRHRGRLLCLGSRAKASTLQGGHRCFAGGSAFHTYFGRAPLLVGDTAEVVSPSATSSTEFAAYDPPPDWGMLLLF